MDFSKVFGDLNIQPSLIVVNMVGFVCLYLLANKLIFKPISKVIDERDHEIGSRYDQIEADQREMSRLKSEYEARLAEIEAEAREKINTAVTEAQTLRDQIIADANTRSREIVTRAEAEAEREREQAMITLRQQIVDLALGATTKVVGESLDADRHKTLIDEFIATGVAEA